MSFFEITCVKGDYVENGVGKVSDITTWASIAASIGKKFIPAEDLHKFINAMVSESGLFANFGSLKIKIQNGTATIKDYSAVAYAVVETVAAFLEKEDNLDVARVTSRKKFII